MMFKVDVKTFFRHQQSIFNITANQIVCSTQSTA